MAIEKTNKFALFLMKISFKTSISILIIIFILSLAAKLLFFQLLSWEIFIFSAIPSATAAILFGMRFGIIAAAIMPALSLALLIKIEMKSYSTDLLIEFVASIIINILIAFIVALVRNLNLKLLHEYSLRKTIESEKGTQHKELHENINVLEKLINDIKQTERDLIESEKGYKELVEKAGIAILTQNPDGLITYFNEQFLELFSYQFDEVNGIPLLSFVHPDDLSIVLDYQTRLIQEKTNKLRYEFKGLKSDDTIIFVEVDAVLLKKEGWTIGIRSYLWDITERKIAELALKESEERFRRIFEEAAFGIYRSTPEGNILWANPTFVRILKINSYEQLLHRNLNEGTFEPQYKREDFIEHIEYYNEIIGLEEEWILGDGSKIFIRESAWAVKDENGKTLYYDGIIEDVSMSKRIEKERERLIKELQKALSEVKKLSGLLPICANCKSIRDDAGYWYRLEEYIDSHSEAQFSHGLCPKCAKELYPDYFPEVTDGKPD